MQDTVPEMPVAQLDLVRHDDGRFRPPTMQAPWADRFQTLEKIKAQAVLSDHDRRAAGRNNLAGGMYFLTIVTDSAFKTTRIVVAE